MIFFFFLFFLILKNRNLLKRPLIFLRPCQQCPRGLYIIIEITMIIFLYYKIFIKKKNLSWKKKRGRFSPTILLYPSPKAFPSCCSNLAPKTGDLIIQMLPDKQIFTFNLFILMIAFFWRILSLSFSFLFCLITKLHTQHKRL